MISVGVARVAPTVGAAASAGVGTVYSAKNGECHTVNRRTLEASRFLFDLELTRRRFFVNLILRQI
jgi:hypothetical protein